MRYFANPTGNSPIISGSRGFTWVLVLSFSGTTPTLTFDQGLQIPISTYYPPIRCPVDSRGAEIPWKQLDTTGTLTLLVGEPGDRTPSGSASALSSVKLFDSNGNAIATDGATGRLIVVGAAADGGAAAGAPVLVAGKDNGGLVRTLGVAPEGNGPANSVLRVGGMDGGGAVRSLPTPLDGSARIGGVSLTVGGLDGGNLARPLPVIVAGATAQVGGVGVQELTVGGVDAGLLSRALAVDTSGRQQVVSGDGAVVLANALNSPAAASTVTGATVDITGFSKVGLSARIRGATGGTLDVYIQTGDGTNWWDVAHFTQLAAAGALVGWNLSLERGSGTTIVSVNTADGTPVLAANSKVVGVLGNKLRYVFVAGAGTSAGASQDIRGWGSA